MRDMIWQRANVEDENGDTILLTTPVLIDEMDNPYWSTYGYMPNCAYLIHQNGTVFYKENWFASDSNRELDSSAMKGAIEELVY